MNTIGTIQTVDTIKFRYIPCLISKRLPYSWINALSMKFKKIEYKYIQFDGLDLKILAAYVPFTEQQLKYLGDNDIQVLYNEIAKYFYEQNITYVILPLYIQSCKKIMDLFYAQNQFYKIDEGTILTALLAETLKKICKIMGVHMAQLDLGIIDTALSEKGCYIIKMLSEDAKCITLITKEVEKAKQYTEEIYESTGLTIRISQDFEHTLKNINILFILDDFQEFIKKYSMDPFTIVFNLSSKKLLEKCISNIIIDHIILETPQSIKKSIQGSENIHIDIHELALYLILLHNKQEQDSDHIEIYNHIRRNFYYYGYRISGIRGCNKSIELKKLGKIADYYFSKK